MIRGGLVTLFVRDVGSRGALLRRDARHEARRGGGDGWAVIDAGEGFRIGLTTRARRRARGRGAFAPSIGFYAEGADPRGDRDLREPRRALRREGRGPGHARALPRPGRQRALPLSGTLSDRRGRPRSRSIGAAQTFAARGPPRRGSAAEPRPLPDFMRNKRRMTAADLADKHEGGYFTGLPLVNSDPDTGFGFGARVLYFDNGDARRRRCSRPRRIAIAPTRRRSSRRTGTSTTRSITTRRTSGARRSASARA